MISLLFSRIIFKLDGLHAAIMQHRNIWKIYFQYHYPSCFLWVLLYLCSWVIHWEFGDQELTNRNCMRWHDPPDRRVQLSLHQGWWVPHSILKELLFYIKALSEVYRYVACKAVTEWLRGLLWRLKSLCMWKVLGTVPGTESFWSVSVYYFHYYSHDYYCLAAYTIS